MSTQSVAYIAGYNSVADNTGLSSFV